MTFSMKDEYPLYPGSNRIKEEEDHPSDFDNGHFQR